MRRGARGTSQKSLCDDQKKPLAAKAVALSSRHLRHGGSRALANTEIPILTYSEPSATRQKRGHERKPAQYEGRPPQKAAAREPSRQQGLVEGGAEVEDASADGFDGDGEGECGGFIDEKDDAVKFAFAGTAGEGKADGMKEVAAAEFEFFFELGDHFFKAVGGEGDRIEKEEREKTDDVTSGVSGENGVSFGGSEDLRGVEGEDQAE